LSTRFQSDAYKAVREGLVEVLVPNLDLYKRLDGAYEPAWAPVFYNPRMAHNRDVAIVFAKTYSRMRGVSELTVVEPLAGSGIRAVRYAVEAGAWVVANDIDPLSARLIEKNSELNNVKNRVLVANIDANELLSSLRRRGIPPTIIDLDPFGSPVPFLDAAIKAIRVRGVIAATATDTAPLSGTRPQALRRRYDVKPARTLWEKEQAVRILAGYIIRRAAAHEYGAKVLLAYYKDYYVRVYVELERGAGRADKALDQLGYGASCQVCGYSGFTRNEQARHCPYCSAPVDTVGPLYRGPLCDKKFLEAMIEQAHSIAHYLAAGDEVPRFLEAFARECEITRPYLRVDRVASFLGLNMPSPTLVAQTLSKEEGFNAAVTLFDKRGVKTDAPFNVFVETVRRLAPRPH
jgi:tRNA (guanine26-N2/guanine27-N2)-dimethyltransferase